MIFHTDLQYVPWMLKKIIKTAILGFEYPNHHSYPGGASYCQIPAKKYRQRVSTIASLFFFFSRSSLVAFGMPVVRSSYFNVSVAILASFMVDPVRAALADLWASNATGVPKWGFFERGSKDANYRACKMSLRTLRGATTTLVNHVKRQYEESITSSVNRTCELFANIRFDSVQNYSCKIMIPFGRTLKWKITIRT